MAGNANTSHPAPVRERWIGLTAADGTRLAGRLFHREEDPSAPARRLVLCLGGYLRNSSDFLHIAPDLAGPGRSVFAPDYRGRGRSEHCRRLSGYAPALLVGDLLDWTTALGAREVVVIGTSLGGVLAMGLAVARPGLLQAVVLNDIGPGFDPAPLASLQAFVRNDRPHRTWDTAITDLKRAFTEIGLRDEEDWRRFAHGTFHRADDGFLRFSWDIRLARLLTIRPEDCSRVATIFMALKPVPTLLVRGGNSLIMGPQAASRMQAIKPDLTTITIEGAGHAPTLDEPDSRTAIRNLIDTALPHRV